MLKNLASVAVSDVLNRGFFFLFNVIVARTIPPTEFGIYGLAISLGVWLWAVADAGLTGHGTRLLAQGGDISETVSAVLSTRLPILGVMFSALILILLVIPLTAHEKLIYATAIIYVVGMSIFPGWIARAYHANREYILAYGTVAFCGVLFLFLYLGGLFDSNGLTAGLARTLPWFVGGGFAFWFVSKQLNIYLHWVPQKSLLKQSAPLGMAAIIYNLIPLIPFGAVRVAGTDVELANFSVMMQIQMVLLAGAGVFSSVLMPSYVKQLKSQSRDLRLKWLYKYFLSISAIAVSISIFYVLFGDKLVLMLFGSSYNDAKQYILPFGLSFIFSSLRYSFDSILIASGDYWFMVHTGSFAIILSISFSFMAAHSIFMFAWVVLLTECFLMLLNGVRIKYL